MSDVENKKKILKPDDFVDKQVYEEGPKQFLPVLPLRNLVALPKSIIPVVVGREFSVQAIDFAMKGDKNIFVTAQKTIDVENPGINDIHTYGTRAIILQVARMANGTLKILVEGVARAKIVEIVQDTMFIGAMTCDLNPLKTLHNDSEMTALWRNLYALFKEFVNLNEKITPDVLNLFKGQEDLDFLADTIAVQLHLDFSARQRILELIDVKERAIHLLTLLKNEIEILKAEKNIRKRVQSQVEKHQRDYYLNEQMRAIQQELGREDYQQEIIKLRKLAKKNKLPVEAMEKVEAELKRLEQMQPSSPEASVCRNYVDWLITLPWHSQTKDTVTITQAETLLDSSHASMRKPKERIIEFLAARKFAGSALKKTPIICLVGPPGVGKTSLAKSVADALGRKMVRISLGGMRDEAEIRGHRRTYIGAMPGKIIQAMKKAQVINPVIVLDEIDKMAMDFRGDPASALLEVLDPEQNKDFSDYFLEVGYDLSKTMFITTANVIDNIAYPLLDRMDVIHLSGYTDAEKLDIAKRFLMPKLYSEYALKDSQVIISDEMLMLVIEEYTKEAGVRQLERVLAKLVRKSIQLLLKDKSLEVIIVNKQYIAEWLRVPPFKINKLKKEEAIGLTTGLAWTEVGGDVLEIETTILKGKGALTLTGQLGEVMQESAQAAMSYIRSRAVDFGLKNNFYSEVDVHVHLPEGSIPKDGPSAGITMTVALVSALTKIPVKSSVAMTGEVTLRGRVLPVGGLKEKLLAATRFGITKVIVPQENEKDISEFRNELSSNLEIVYVDTVDKVLIEALVESPFKKKEASPKKKSIKPKSTKSKSVKTKKKTK